jgi:hypothetical protein
MNNSHEKKKRRKKNGPLFHPTKRGGNFLFAIFGRQTFRSSPTPPTFGEQTFRTVKGSKN